MTIDLPAEFKAYVGTFGPQGHDAYCEEPVIWGYPIIQHCGDDVWAKLLAFGTQEFIGNGVSGHWALVVKTLTRDEAVIKYGPITDEVWGPKGGWKSVTFGETKFISRVLKSPRPTAKP